MALEDRGIVKAVGLHVFHSEDEEVVGTTTDVLVGLEGRVISFRAKHGWLSHDQTVPASSAVFDDGRLVTSHRETEESSENPMNGLMGALVQTRGGHVLGKVINILVEPPSFHVTGLELSGGMVKDWIRGRSIIVLDSLDSTAVGEGGIIVLPDDVDVEDVISLDGRPTEKLRSDEVIPSVPLPNGVSSIDWARVRDTPEEAIRQEMARVVWERRGAPRNSEGGDFWLELVQPWAADLKQAAMEGNTSAFEDVALLSDDQVEALGPFRVPQETTQPT